MDDAAHDRRSIRLPAYDYSWPGAYFVTICTGGRRCCLAAVHGRQSLPSEAGRLVRETWDSLPARWPEVDVDACAVMPNHVHGIVVIQARVSLESGAAVLPPGGARGEPAASGSGPFPCDAERRAWGGQNLSGIVRAFKAASTRLIREGGLPDFAWQRNFYEHIVRSEAALTRIRRYVLDNPQMWGFDVENPGMPVGAHGRIRQVLAHRYGFDEDEVAAAMGTDRAQ